MKVEFKNGAVMKGDAVDIYRELEEIRIKNDGELERHLIVEAAKEESSHLHQEFEWDDEVAAAMQRMTKAGDIIRCLVIIDDKNMVTRCYQTTENVTVENNQVKKKTVYKTIEDVMKEPADREALLCRAERELCSFRKKYEVLTELTKVFDSIQGYFDEAIAEIKKEDEEEGAA